MMVGGEPREDREERLRRLMAQHKSDLMRICYVYLTDEALAEDAVQETFIKAYRALDSFRGEAKEKTWLTSIAVNVCKDMKRNSWFRLVDRRVSLDALPERIQQSLSPWDGELLEDVMNLPTKEKDVVLMYYYQGMTVEEIAEALGCSKATVSKRMIKARSRLRGLMEGGEDYGTPCAR